MNAVSEASDPVQLLTSLPNEAGKKAGLDGDSNGCKQRKMCMMIACMVPTSRNQQLLLLMFLLPKLASLPSYIKAFNKEEHRLV